MVGVIKVDPYPFLAFSDLICHFVSDCTTPPDSKENELGSSDHKGSPSAGKNNSLVAYGSVS